MPDFAKIRKSQPQPVFSKSYAMVSSGFSGEKEMQPNNLTLTSAPHSDEGRALSVNAARFGPLAPKVGQKSPEELALQLAALARKDPLSGSHILPQISPELAAKAILLVPSDVMAAQLLEGLEAISAGELKMKILFYMDMFDPSIQEGENRRDRINKLLETICFRENTPPWDIPMLRVKAIKALSDHLEKYGWSNMQKLKQSYGDFSFFGMVTIIRENGDEVPVVIFVQRNFGSVETARPNSAGLPFEGEIFRYSNSKIGEMSRYQFPDDSVGRVLVRKELEGTLLGEEKFELMAKRQFPNDSRGRELAIKELQGVLRDDEKQELMSLRVNSRRDNFMVHDFGLKP